MFRFVRCSSSSSTVCTVRDAFALDTYGYMDKRAHQVIHDLASHGEEEFQYLANSTFNRGRFIQYSYQSISVALQKSNSQ